MPLAETMPHLSKGAATKIARQAYIDDLEFQENEAAEAAEAAAAAAAKAAAVRANQEVCCYIIDLNPRLINKGLA